MIVLTERARKEIEGYFEGKEKEPIRIYLAAGGCHGPRLGLALDEPSEDDETVEADGLTFCISKNLYKIIGGAKIDLTDMGFIVKPDVPLAQPENSCGGSCCGSCGSCGSSSCHS